MFGRKHSQELEEPIILDSFEEQAPLIAEGRRQPDTLLAKIKHVLPCFQTDSNIERTIEFDGEHRHVPFAFPANVVRNQKYSVVTFVPLFLYDQFKYFFNLYFLVVALTQFIPVLQVGFLFTYVAPLAFVLIITMIKEGYEDFKRFLRDREANSQKYERLTPSGTEVIPSSRICVGDLIVLHADQRVPADMVLLRVHDKSASVFIRTDQLDGETDWKLRNPVLPCQQLPSDAHLLKIHGRLSAEAPHKEIYTFAGNFQIDHIDGQEAGAPSPTESLNLEHTMWKDTVVASATVIGIVIYTGSETRSVMNASTPQQKTGRLDLELNFFSKILFVITVFLASVLIILKGFDGIWWIYFFRFILLLSSIIPISLRVNLDLGKMLYSVFIMTDKKAPDTIVRTSTIPEELGRVTYLFSDKTGTLTQNVMTFNTLQMEPPLAFTKASIGKLREVLAHALKDPKCQRFTRKRGYSFDSDSHSDSHSDSGSDGGHGLFEEETKQDNGEGLGLTSTPPIKRHQSFSDSRSDRQGLLNQDLRSEEVDVEDSVVAASSTDHIPVDGYSAMVAYRTVVALALCHNVTPVHDADSSETVYQASSPDEVALVKFTESVGIKLHARDQKFMSLRLGPNRIDEYDILNIFPFTSENKRMGIIVKSRSTGEILFLLKGAESVMQQRIEPSDWLEEEVDNLARVGLRTLVIAYRELDAEEYERFNQRYLSAKAVIKDRETQVQAVIRTLEKDMELLALTGVEDKLQEGVKSTLETLRNAGIRVWMLTGDKAETATCIGRSARLIDRGQSIFQFIVRSKRDAATALDAFSTKMNTCLIIDGPSLQLCLDHFEGEFLDLACQAPSVICCRCSPTQKAEMVRLVKEHTSSNTCSCAIGDGGNDVNMIQTADVGIGIVGKEGKQASLAADFSITQFSFISRLLLWHGRNSYKRSARLSQFVIHRGLIISVIQVVFSMFFFYAAVPIYNGWLLVGYATFYTMCPVFSLVLDEDVNEETVFMFPQLYKELQKGRPLSMKTFLIWVWISFYQGGIIMIFTIVLFENNFLNVVGITFTALILSELMNVALEINKWHKLMVLAEVASIAAYFASIFVLRTYFEITFILTKEFLWKVTVVTALSTLPPALTKFFYRKWSPPVHSKVSGGSRYVEDDITRSLFSDAL